MPSLSPSVYMDSRKPTAKDLYSYLEEVSSKIKEAQASDARLHIMDQEIDPELDGRLDEVLSCIESVLEWRDHDPTPDYGDSEPSMTMVEIHERAWRQHVQMHR